MSGSEHGVACNVGVAAGEVWVRRCGTGAADDAGGVVVLEVSSVVVLVADVDVGADADANAGAVTVGSAIRPSSDARPWWFVADREHQCVLVKYSSSGQHSYDPYHRQ